MAIVVAGALRAAAHGLKEELDPACWGDGPEAMAVQPELGCRHPSGLTSETCSAIGVEGMHSGLFGKPLKKTNSTLRVQL